MLQLRWIMSIPALLRTGVVIPGVMSTIAAPLQSSPGLALVSISATRHVPWTKHPCHYARSIPMASKNHEKTLWKLEADGRWMAHGWHMCKSSFPVIDQGSVELKWCKSQTWWRRRISRAIAMRCHEDIQRVLQCVYVMRVWSIDVDWHVLIKPPSRYNVTGKGRIREASVAHCRNLKHH